MTHEEFESRLEALTDADAGAVLEHTQSCAACRRNARRAEAALGRLEGRRRSIFEEIARWAAVAAVLAVAAYGLWRNQTPAPAPKPAPTARYRIVGNASGVVAYTPEGIVIGTANRPIQKEIMR